MSANEAELDVEVQLLDVAQGEVIKVWRFTGQTAITIGRGPERDVALGNEFVSRIHAELAFREGQWLLLSHGKNGVLVNNRQVDQFAARGELIFRLGNKGPVLKFRPQLAETETEVTFCYQLEAPPVFQLNEQKVQEEVGAIAGRDDFERLRQQALALRRKRQES